MHFSLKPHHFQTASSVLPVKMQGIIITAIDGQKTNGVHKVSVLSFEDSFGITPHLYLMSLDWPLAEASYLMGLANQQADHVLY